MDRTGVSPGVDDEGLPMPPRLGERGQRLVRWLGYGENGVFMAIAVVLFAIAVATLVRTVHDAAWPPAPEPFAETITRALNGVLFIVITLEVLRTIVVRFEGGGFQLQPFLVIGIISAVRHILTVGAQLSLVGEQLPLARTMTELGVNAAVVLALAVALVLVRRFARLGGS
jgi:uncharacterized membrane protein (DUF373 family)